MTASNGFSQLHIDVARYATDDFNPFHDAGKWCRLRGNPFGGPIVLGFQTLTWLSEAVEDYRQRHDDRAAIEMLPFSNYQINFVSALKPGQAFELVVKSSQFDGERGILGNRVCIKSDAGLVLMGHHRLSRDPLVLTNPTLDGLPDLVAMADRSEIPGTPYFLKRKFIMAANAKNFLLGSLVDPTRYFDELENRVRFPEMFPLSYLSCALLERAWLRGHDFEADPMVYSRHEISVNRVMAGSLSSNDRLHILIMPDEQSGGNERFRCYGLIDNTLLYRAVITLTPLAQIVKALRQR